MVEGQRIILIGVVEESRERITFKLLKEIFAILNYDVIYENKAESMIVLCKECKTLIVMDIKPGIISSIEDIGIDFDIILHTFLNIKDYENKSLKTIFSKAKYIIVNCDEEKWNLLLNDNIKSILITYGFNNKATVNPSSYNNQDLMEAVICFQREVETMDGNVIEPFEFPIKIDTEKKLDIYSVIAIVVCGLVLGEKILKNC